MNLFGRRGSLIQIFFIGIFIASLPEAESLFNKTRRFLSNRCHNILNLPENICHYTVGQVNALVNYKCNSTGQLLCDQVENMPEVYHKCRRGVRYYVCVGIEDVVGLVETLCVKELGKFLISKGRDSKGNTVSICDGIPKLSALCSITVNTMCDKLPWFLYPLIVLCQKIFNRVICHVRM